MQVRFHLLSFEGPDAYARAGGIATRVTGLSSALADAGFETHLWFVGDADLPGHEVHDSLHLHRWCQWISRYHPNGVYDGEYGKEADYASSLPPVLIGEYLLPQLQEEAAGSIVVLAEEWQTVAAVLHIDWLLRLAGVRERVTILWNANNTFSLDRIDWRRLREAAVITTVSKYMKHLMRGFGVDALVIPNGLSPEALQRPEPRGVGELRHRLRDRVVLAKVARWDPDKRWLLAMRTAAELKRGGYRPLLIARGGVEAHGTEVMCAAADLGLRVVARGMRHGGVEEMVEALADCRDADVVNLRSPLDPPSHRVLLRAASAVLANSGHEPFGLVGLETMAVGGLACTGCSGEDYALAGQNALVLQTENPHECVGLLRELRANPAQERAIRRGGQVTARQYAWDAIVARNLIPRLRILGHMTPVGTSWARASTGEAGRSRQADDRIAHHVE